MLHQQCRYRRRMNPPTTASAMSDQRYLKRRTIGFLRRTSSARNCAEDRRTSNQNVDNVTQTRPATAISTVLVSKYKEPRMAGNRKVTWCNARFGRGPRSLPPSVRLLTCGSLSCHDFAIQTDSRMHLAGAAQSLSLSQAVGGCAFGP